jgi:hypothetical protein
MKQLTTCQRVRSIGWSVVRRSSTSLLVLPVRLLEDLGHLDDLEV